MAISIDKYVDINSASSGAGSGSGGSVPAGSSDIQLFRDPASGRYFTPSEYVGTVEKRADGKYYANGVEANIVTAEVNPVTGMIEISGGATLATDTRRLAKWYRNGGDIVLLGDSTTERLSTTVTGDGALSVAFKGMFPSFPRTAKVYNRGASGVTAAAIASGDVTNSSGYHCGASYVAQIPAGLFRVALGINDMRSRASIAGSSYGSAAQIAAAADLRGSLVSIYNTIKAAQPNACFIFSLPHGHATSSAYFENSVTGQNCLDVYRLAYLGDAALGVPGIESLTTDSIVVDTQTTYGSRTAYTVGSLNGVIDADGLHEGNGVGLLMASLLFAIEGVPPIQITTYKQLRDAYEYELFASKGHTALAYADMQLVAEGRYSGNGSSYVDVALHSVDVAVAAASAWGAAAGSARGATSAPTLAVGDVMVWYDAAGSVASAFIVKRAPDNNGGGYLRWFGGHPSGSGGYPNATDLRAQIYRPKHSSLAGVLGVSKTQGGSSVLSAFGARSKRYRYAMDAVANGSCTLRAVGAAGADYLDSSAHALSASDVLCAAGIAGGPAGLSLSAATIAAGTGVGAWTVTLAGMDFRASHGRLVDVWSAT